MHEANTPNIVFIISDQHRRDACGAYGHPMVRTPQLDRLASQGTVFTSAYAAAPICGPCRSAVVTGRNLHRCGAFTHRHMEVDMGLPTMGTIFREAGYATGAFGKVHVAGESEHEDLGFDERALRIYTPMHNDYQHTIGMEKFWQYASYLPDYPHPDGLTSRNTYNPTNSPIQLEEELIFDRMVADRSVNFMERHCGEPFFLWVGFEKPHPEWYAPQRFHEMYDPSRISLPENIWDSRSHLPSSISDNPAFPIVTREAYTDQELRCCIAAYYANISYMDEQLGRVLDAIERLGIAENTMVVYSSDHGENLFEHGLVHKMNFFECSAGVPLIVRIPGVGVPGAVNSQLVSLVDLLPTFCEVADVPAPAGLDGISLLPALTTGREVRDAVFCEYYDAGIAERMIRVGPWKYVHSHEDTPQLYHLEDDPSEDRNLAGDPRYKEIVRDLETRILDGWQMPDLSFVPRLRRDTRPGQRSSKV